MTPIHNTNNDNNNLNFDQNIFLDALQKGYECYSKLNDYFHSSFYIYFLVIQLIMLLLVISYTLFFESLYEEFSYLFTILLNMLAAFILIDLFLWICYNVRNIVIL